MTASELVRARLLQIAGVTALVGTRIYNVKFPQGPKLPAIRVQRISEPEFMHLRGGVKLYRSRVQIDAVVDERSGDDPYLKATSIDEALWKHAEGSALGGWSGVIGTGPAAVVVTGVLPIDIREGYDAVELNQFKVMRDVYVWHAGN